MARAEDLVGEPVEHRLVAEGFQGVGGAREAQEGRRHVDEPVRQTLGHSAGQAREGLEDDGDVAGRARAARAQRQVRLEWAAAHRCGPQRALVTFEPADALGRVGGVVSAIGAGAGSHHQRAAAVAPLQVEERRDAGPVEREIDQAHLGPQGVISSQAVGEPGRRLLDPFLRQAGWRVLPHLRRRRVQAADHRRSQGRKPPERGRERPAVLDAGDGAVDARVLEVAGHHLWHSQHPLAAVVAVDDHHERPGGDPLDLAGAPERELVDVGPGPLQGQRGRLGVRGLLHLQDDTAERPSDPRLAIGRDPHRHEIPTSIPPLHGIAMSVSGAGNHRAPLAQRCMSARVRGRAALVILRWAPATSGTSAGHLVGVSKPAAAPSDPPGCGRDRSIAMPGPASRRVLSLRAGVDRACGVHHRSRAGEEQHLAGEEEVDVVGHG